MPLIQKSQTFVCDSCRGILIAFIALFILITLNQLGRTFVTRVEAQLFFRGSGPEDTVIEIDNFKVEYMLDTIFILFGKSVLRIYSTLLPQGNSLFRSLEITCQV